MYQLNLLFTWQKDEFAGELVTVQKEGNSQEECEDKADGKKYQVGFIFVLTRTSFVRRLRTLLESLLIFTHKAPLRYILSV